MGKRSIVHSALIFHKVGPHAGVGPTARDQRLRGYLVSYICQLHSCIIIQEKSEEEILLPVNMYQEANIKNPAAAAAAAFCLI